LCQARLEGYYARFGFRRVGFRETRGVVRAKYLFTRMFRLFGVRISVMKRIGHG